MTEKTCALFSALLLIITLIVSSGPLSSIIASANSKLPSCPETVSNSSENELSQKIIYFINKKAEAAALEKKILERIKESSFSLKQFVQNFSEKEIQAFLERAIVHNLSKKFALDQNGPGKFPLSEHELLNTVVEYEIFKLNAFLGSGVFPKRYFGYFDLKWDTTEAENELLITTHAAVKIINDYQKKNQRSVRLTDLEVLITYIAEGGALLLREDQWKINSSEGNKIHIMHDLGCDNFALAMNKYPELLKKLDFIFHTELSGSKAKTYIASNKLECESIERLVSFGESIVGNALMYLFEKEIAHKKLKAIKDNPNRIELWKSYDLNYYSLKEQFIISSLVYNSGILFNLSTIQLIRDFKTMEYLYNVSETSAKKQLPHYRPRLPVFKNSDEAFSYILKNGYPLQPTSWQAAYHILQRYGAFAGILDFTDTFNEKGFWKNPGKQN